MKRFLLFFMVIGFITAISATRPNSSDGNSKTSRTLKQQENYQPQSKFTLKLINNGDIKFDIVLTNTITQQTYGPYTVNGDSIVQKRIKAGTYDIQVTPETMPANFFATILPGCATLYEGYPGSTATIYCDNIALNSSSCNGSIVTDIEWVGH